MMEEEQKDEILITTTELTVHRRSISPVFGLGIVHVKLDDEGGGPFVTLKQMRDGLPEDGYNTIKIDFEEIEHIVKAVKMLQDASKKFES